MKSLPEKINSYLAYLDGRRAQLKRESILFGNPYAGGPLSEWWKAGFTDQFNEGVHKKGGTYDTKESFKPT